jgi:hypothetical protein
MSTVKGNKLPSKAQIGEKVKVCFVEGQEIAAKVFCVHFYESKVKYDVELQMGEDCTRIYNVDSCYINAELS